MQGVAIVIGCVVVVVIVVSTRLISKTNQLNLAKKWFQYVSNRGIQSTNVTNSAFLLATVSMPITSLG